MNKKYIYGGLALLVIGGGVAFYLYKKRKNQIVSPMYRTTDTIVAEIDTTSKGYVKLTEAIKKWKEFFKKYAKSGLTLKDMATGENTSTEATETTYLFATNEVVNIENGIANDSTISNEQKLLLKEIADSYFNDYLPLYFDKARYNMYSTWYKDKLSKMKTIDYYNK